MPPSPLPAMPDDACASRKRGGRELRPMRNDCSAASVVGSKVEGRKRYVVTVVAGSTGALSNR